MTKKWFFTFMFGLIVQSFCLAQAAKTDNIPYSPKIKKNKIKHFKSVILSDTLRETSGLVEWNNHLYTHNDDRDLNLYQLDKNGKILKSINLEGIQNKDWEEIAQDETHFYLGDIGNNVSGNRTDLFIYKIEKKSLFDIPKIEKISFTYSNQTDFSKQKKRKTDFDAEAIVVTKNELYIFTKQWKSKSSSIYRLPKVSGTYQAEYIKTIPVKGLVTGATYLEDKNLIVLCGYSKKLKPFLYVLTNITDFNFQNVNQQKIKLKLPFHQIEGISTTNGVDFYLTNEKITHKIIGTIPAQLHYFSIEIKN